MEKSFKSVIDASKSVLILLPDSPSFDQVAGALALYLSLEGKKDISVSCPSPMVVEFNRLVGVDRISDEIGNKNLVLRFTDYVAENIERVSYDIESQEFRLTVIPKPQMEPPKKEQVKIAYSGVSADTTILIGGAKKEDFPALALGELSETKLVHIGTLDLSVEGRNIISLSRPASSVSEIIAEYIRELEGGFHPDIAGNLLAGIHEGSKNFTGSGVNSDTFKLAGELMQAGGKYNPKSETPQMRFSAPGMPLPTRPQPKSIPMDSPEEETDKPQGEAVNPPKSWLTPKIYKGTSVN